MQSRLSSVQLHMQLVSRERNQAKCSPYHPPAATLGVGGVQVKSAHSAIPKWLHSCLISCGYCVTVREGSGVEPPYPGRSGQMTRRLFASAGLCSISPSIRFP